VNLGLEVDRFLDRVLDDRREAGGAEERAGGERERPAEMRERARAGERAALSPGDLPAEQREAAGCASCLAAGVVVGEAELPGGAFGEFARRDLLV